MADALVSSLINTILGNLNNLVVGESAILGGLRSEVENLESTLTTIQAVLHDAEEKQWKSEAIQNWLRKLKNAAYDADDVLDEFTIEAERRRLQRDLKNRVRSFFSIENPLVFHAKMAHRLKSVRGKLDAIASEKHKFHLREGVRNIEEIDSFDWRQTSSLVNESEICGRDKEKEDLVNVVLSNSDDFSVYAICGMGGLGKTTLAQLVYNDTRVESHFDLRIWVCVSDDFEIMRLTRAIIESIEGSPCNIQELDPLQRRLQEKLSGRKFLLVLDDVWNEYRDKWNGLKNALRCGARGSTLIITTRIEKIALMMATAPVHHMVRLSEDDSWSLFERYAFGMKSKEKHAHLDVIGKDIVKKCGGVPLAVKALGSLMRFKRKENEWLSIKESDIWDLPDDGKTILPALKLSYDHLPPHLRQCFSFCSIFPKDYVMKKEQLVGLWMANGFIACRGPMDLHDMGNEIFEELVWRSFLQDIVVDYSGNITCKMHDLVHDLAQSIMKHECCLMEANRAFEVSRDVRHVSVYNNGLQSIPWNNNLHRVQSLRSLVLFNNGWKDIHSYFSGKNNLRALDLSGSFFKKWPNSIGKLKHLRYLKISSSQIKALPESVTSLQKLQTLNLAYCHSLLTLPQGLRHMKNLIYLNITECDSLHCMPAGIGQLTCLRKLSMFIVGKDDGHHIGELKGLDIVGKLTIKDLHNIKNLSDAKSANLMLKNNLESLELIWQEDNNNNSTEKIEEVLCGLQPHSNLKKLRIDGYGGSKFPDWMMDLLLPNLIEISLQCCGKCEHLPPFGKLRFLKVLDLRGMDVKCIDTNIYGNGGSSIFPLLEELTIFSMGSLEKWAMVDGRDFFPQLGELTVGDCPKLVELPIIPSVKKLNVEGKSEMPLRSVQNFTFLTSLAICWFPEITHLPSGLLRNYTLLQDLRIDSMTNLESMSNQLDNLTALKRLDIVSCDKLENLPECLWSLNSLETLTIWCCDSIVSLTINELCGPSSLRNLYIQQCRKFTSLSEGMQNLTALEKLLLFECPELKSLPESIKYLTALRSLYINCCEGLTCLPNEIRHLVSLSRLEITNCPNLMCLPEGLQSLKNLKVLRISDCPYLKKRCAKERGEDWPKIAHIPHIRINSFLRETKENTRC